MSSNPIDYSLNNSRVELEGVANRILRGWNWLDEGSSSQLYWRKQYEALSQELNEFGLALQAIGLFISCDWDNGRLEWSYYWPKWDLRARGFAGLAEVCSAAIAARTNLMLALPEGQE